MNQEWWKVARDQSEAKKAKTASERGVTLGDKFLIVTEGEVTEPQYFYSLRDHLRVLTADIVVTNGKTSDPLSVVKTAYKLRKESSYDHVWAVVDTDKPVAEGKWRSVLDLAKKYNVHVASSTACFEYWMLLHLCSSTAPQINGIGAKKCLIAQLKLDSYNACSTTNEREARKLSDYLMPKLEEALDNAALVRKLGSSYDPYIPCNPSTTVDLLIKDIQFSIDRRG